MRRSLLLLTILIALLATSLLPRTAARADVNRGIPSMSGVADRGYGDYGLISVYGQGFLQGAHQPLTVTDETGRVLASAVLDLARARDGNWTWRAQLPATCARVVTVSARYPQDPSSYIASDITIPLGDPVAQAWRGVADAAALVSTATPDEYQAAQDRLTAAQLAYEAARAQARVCGY